ncbi:unnamed protein product, partial [marine sediment metagenome]
LAENISEILSTQKHTFAVRSTSSVEKRLGGKIVKKTNLTVNLEEPEIEILCFQIRSNYYVGIKLPLKRDFEKRKPQFRPYFSPTSMHPKIARLLVNLARVKPGDTLLDPFCGTGGILIEAAMMEMKVKGIDWDERAVEGCQENLHFYHLTGKIRQGDALKLKLREEVDAIVTDPPYGRSSLLTEKNLEKLYENFLLSAG